MKFITDATDIVRGANIFMWSNFAPHENLCMLCGGSTLKAMLLHMKLFACHLEQNCPMLQAILLHIVCIIMIYAVMTQNPFCRKMDSVAIFTLFCGKRKLPQKFCTWSKNDKYPVQQNYIKSSVIAQNPLKI